MFEQGTLRDDTGHLLVVSIIMLLSRFNYSYRDML
jgi:hypothetical protein